MEKTHEPKSVCLQHGRETAKRTRSEYPPKAERYPTPQRESPYKPKEPPTWSACLPPKNTQGGAKDRIVVTSTREKLSWMRKEKPDVLGI